MVNWLQLPAEEASWKKIVLYILVAWIFAFGMRLVWVDWIKSDPQRLTISSWNNEIMINTNDGYWFAEGARDILKGGHEPNDLSPVTEPLSQLTALLAQIVPVSFERLILYMPAIFGSLLVIPIILIGQAFKQPTVGFAAALLASIAHSYYNRTMVGYYDTDLLTIVLPTFVLYTIILAYQTHKKSLLPLVTLAVATNFWWYPQSYALLATFAAMAFVYALLFERKNPFGYAIPLFILIGFIMIPFWVKIVLTLAIWQAWERLQERIKPLWFLLGLYAAGLALFAATGGIAPILAQLKAYVFRQEVSQVAGNLFFYDIATTVREAGEIPFKVFAERISGHQLTFILSVVGFALAILANRLWLLALPMVGLGFLGLTSGLRFTVYAVPVMALGLTWLLAFTLKKIENPTLRPALLLLLTAAALYPNYRHIQEYQVPTVFSADEVATLEQLKKIAKREDYVISWWDYGYPIRYYSDVKTLVDGGKHTGDVNWPVAYILTEDNPTAVAQLARLFTEYTEKRYHDESNFSGNDVLYMMTKEGFKDPNAFIDALKQESYKLPAKTRDIYIMLPYRMLEIFPTVRLFANLDLTTGQPIDRSFFYSTQQFSENGSVINLGNNIAIDKTKWSVTMGGSQIPLASVTLTHYEGNRLVVNEQPLSPSGELSLIVMRDYHTIILADKKMANSTFVKLFVTEEVDSRYFEPVLLSPMIKIYRLKI
ncbi:MAG: peptide transporter [Campylobacterales bacterium]